MRTRLRFWLTGLLAGLFALAIVPAPAEHARAVLAQAVFVADYAMPDGTLPDLCSDHGEPVDGHGRHLLEPACFACVIMAAPGLPIPCFIQAARIDAVAAADLRDRESVEALQAAWAARWARGPPGGSMT